MAFAHGANDVANAIGQSQQLLVVQASSLFTHPSKPVLYHLVITTELQV